MVRIEEGILPWVLGGLQASFEVARFVCLSGDPPAPSSGASRHLLPELPLREKGIRSPDDYFIRGFKCFL